MTSETLIKLVAFGTERFGANIGPIVRSFAKAHTELITDKSAEAPPPAAAAAIDNQVDEAIEAGTIGDNHADDSAELGDDHGSIETS